MDKTEIAKMAVGFVVGAGTAKVVREIIKNNVTNSNKMTEQAAMIVATYVLGAIAADASKNWTDAKIDKLVIWWTENITKKLASE